VDEYLSDKEQLERVRQWWRENGWFLLGGVAIGLLAIYGYRQYFVYRDGQAEAAAALYEAVKQSTDDSDTAAAETAYQQLRTDHPNHAYTYQAALLLARGELVSAPDSAVEKLRFAMEGTSDPDLAIVARLRLARVLAYREQYDEALAVLAVEAPGEFAGRINEIRGDIYATRGDTNAARTAYLEALAASGAELLDYTFLQMKLGDLPAASPEPAPEGEGAPVTPVDAAEAPGDAAPAGAPAAPGEVP
jgi:predicted negative regulator of RcsB-dependent stress response